MIAATPSAAEISEVTYTEIGTGNGSDPHQRTDLEELLLGALRKRLSRGIEVQWELLYGVTTKDELAKGPPSHTKPGEKSHYSSCCFV